MSIIYDVCGTFWDFYASYLSLTVKIQSFLTDAQIPVEVKTRLGVFLGAPLRKAQVLSALSYSRAKSFNRLTKFPLRIPSCFKFLAISGQSE